jgi:hypothetical protein
MMVAVNSAETSGSLYRTTRPHISEVAIFFIPTIVRNSNATVLFILYAVMVRSLELFSHL